MYSGQNIIRVFNNEEYMLNDFECENDKLYEAAWKSNFISGLMHPIMNRPKAIWLNLKSLIHQQ